MLLIISFLVLANALLRKMWTRAHVAFFHPVRCLKYLVLDIEGHVPRAGLSSDHSRDCPLIIQAGGICQGQQNWPTVFGTLFGSRSASKHLLQAMQIYDPFLLGCGRRISNQLPSLRACFVGGLSPIHYMEASR